MGGTGLRQRLAAILAASQHARGRVEEARREVAEAKRQDPALHLSAVGGRLSIMRDRARVTSFIALLRELGLD